MSRVAAVPATGGVLELDALRAGPPPEGAPGTPLPPHEALARRVVAFLFGNQVVAVDAVVLLERTAAGTREGVLTTRLLRRADPVQVRIVARSEGRTWDVWMETAGQRGGPIREGELFRMDLTGRVTGLPGFRGLRPPASGLRGLVKAGLRRLRPTARAMVRARQLAFERRRAFELSRIEGVTWRLRRLDASGTRLELEAYDAGGIYDEHLNGEGNPLPPQVAGNHYADAYAAYAFAWHYRRTGRTEYLEAARAALAFVRRVYPQYAATGYAAHHSDFKNPAFLETVESLLAPVKALDGGELAACRDLIQRFRESAYNPTNVFALRFHWHTARAAVSTEEPAAIARCLARLRRDQTVDGLIQDNYIHYPDAHDLTYHQYSLASLAQGLAWQDIPEIRQRFLDGVALSLALTTPDGEIAYVGRGAHNVYHVASAVLAFEAAARLHAARPTEAGAFRRGAWLLATQLERWQQPDGMLPTAMNTLIADRVAWNHCETPYNALVATLLQKASRLADAAAPAAPLPMDRPGYLRVFDEAGFAAVRAGALYAVVFSGCAPSYLWSGRTHRTGVAGLAQLGLAGHGPLLPILDAPPGAGIGPITDLPVVNDAVPFGRGRLEAVEGPVPAILFRHAYGRAAVDRLYLFVGRTVLVVTRIAAAGFTGRLRVRGLVSVALRVGDGWTYAVHPSGGRVRATGPTAGLTAVVLHAAPDMPIAARVGPPVTNPRGRAVRIDLVDAEVRPRLPVVGCHALQADGGGEGDTSSSLGAEPEPRRLGLRVGSRRLAVRLDAWPQVESL